MGSQSVGLKVPWSNRKSLCPMESLHVEPTDFQSNKPNYHSTDQLSIGLIDFLMDFQCNNSNQLSVQQTESPLDWVTSWWTKGLSGLPINFEIWKLPIQQNNLSFRPTNFQSNRPTSHLLVQWEVGLVKRFRKLYVVKTEQYLSVSSTKDSRYLPQWILLVLFNL